MKPGDSDWFQTLLEKLEETEQQTFVNIGEIFQVDLESDGKVIKTWDLTNELKENGVAHLEIKNETLGLNVDVAISFIHKSLEETLNDLPGFREVMDNYNKGNWSETRGTLMGSEGFDQRTVAFLIVGSVFVILALIDFIFELKENSKIMVKLVRCIFPVMNMIMGMFIQSEEIAANLIISGVVSSFYNLFLAVFSFSSCLLQTTMTFLKFYQTTVYTFQCFIIYKPFVFREHKKRIEKILVFAVFIQLVTIYVPLTIWRFGVVYLKSGGRCDDLRWHLNIMSVVETTLLLLGYAGSAMLCIIYIVGYYHNSTKDVGSNQRSDLKLCLLTSSVEISFDLGILCYLFWHRIQDMGALLSDNLIDGMHPDCENSASLIMGTLYKFPTYALKILSIQMFLQTIVRVALSIHNRYMRRKVRLQK